MGQIFGIWRFDGGRPSERDVRLATAQMGNPPSCSLDMPGIWLVESGGAPGSTISGAGHTMAGPACVFDGRIDNRADLLQRHGGDLSAAVSDRDIACAVYRAAGARGLREIIGDWSLAIWDATARQLLLASDFAGIRPLYYCRQADRIVCATSLVLLRNLIGRPEIERAWILQMLTQGSSRGLTPWPGVYPVPAGTATRLEQNSEVREPFWELPVEKELHYDDEREYEEHLRLLFEEAVSVRLPRGLPVCAEMSGGLDSSSIVSFARRLLPGIAWDSPGLTTFSYHYEGSKDLTFIRRMEDSAGATGIHLDTEKHPFVAPDKVGNGSLVFWQPRLEEVARRMRDLAAGTLLTGQLGDLIMSNWGDDSEQVADLFSIGEFAQAAREALIWSRELRLPFHAVLGRALTASMFAGVSWISSDLSGGGGRVRETSLTRSAQRRGDEMVRAQSGTHRWRNARPSARKRLWAMSGILDTRGLQCPEPMERFSVSHPFAHRPLVEFMLRIPSGIACRPGEPRRLMRRSFSGIVPDYILKRKSKAVYNTVFAQALRPMAKSLQLHPARVRLVEIGYVDSASLQQRLARFLDGLDCNEGQLRVLIALEFWLRSQSLAG